MPTKLFFIIEWFLGYVVIGLAALSFLFIMFTDNPHFEDKLSKFQSLIFQYQGIVSISIVVVIAGSFIMKFIVKDFPWSHLVGAVSIASLFYFYIFFSAYFSKP